MCRDFLDVDHASQQHGWYGWSLGTARPDYTVYVCSCGNHTIYVATKASNPDDYRRHCEYMRDVCSTDG